MTTFVTVDGVECPTYEFVGCSSEHPIVIPGRNSEPSWMNYAASVYTYGGWKEISDSEYERVVSEIAKDKEES